MRGILSLFALLVITIGEQEKAFRKDPVGASSEIVRKVFGALR